MALLAETSYRYSWASTVASKLSKLRQILEFQSVQLLSDVEHEEDQCVFLEKTLDRLSTNTAAFKNCRRQYSSREVRRRSEATATSCDNSIGATSRYPSPSGVRSKQSRRPSNELKLEDQNIYSNPMSSRFQVKVSTSQLNADVALPKEETSPVRVTASIFSRRSTAWEALNSSHKKVTESYLNKPPMRDSCKPNHNLGEDLLLENQEKLPTSPKTSPPEPVAERTNPGTSARERLLNHGMGSLKKMLKAQVSEALLISRKQSFTRQEVRFGELEHKQLPQILKEASSAAEDLNTTLKKLKIKSRGVLDKLSENKQKAIKGTDGLLSRKGSAGGPVLQGSHAEVKVLSLAVPVSKDKYSPARTLGSKLHSIWSP